MQDYRVDLDVYHGPLDLLLYLIRRDEVDIHDIPVHRITEQYLAHVRTLKTLDINLAGEFLVMAASLMEIKSAMMAPRPETEDGEPAGALDPAASGGGEDPTDPRYELVQQLLAYKRFKDAAHALERRRLTFDARFPRKPAAFERETTEPPALDLEDVSVWDLLEAFSRLMDQVGAPPRIDLVHDDTPLELHAADIADRLARDGSMTLQAMFAGRRPAEMLGMFLATLELIRQQKVKAEQDGIAGEIRLVPRPPSEWFNAEDEPDRIELKFDPADPDNFDWPDEPTRRRYTRRMERRARGEVIAEDAEFEEDVKAIEAEESPAPAPRNR